MNDDAKHDRQDLTVQTVWQHGGMGQYRPAAICRRGHVITSDTTLGQLVSARCGTCGAMVMTSCSACGNPIRGVYHVEGFIGGGLDYQPPDFCADCGDAFPWLSRAGRVYLLQNILDESDLTEAEKLRAREQLETLADDDLDDEEQARLWARFKKAAPTVWAGDRAQRIIDTILETGTRAMIDKYG